MGALACETASETASHTPGNDGLSGLPRYPSRKGAGSARGYTACCLQLAVLGTRRSSCWLQVLTWTRGEPYPWRANGSPMCADSRAAKTPTGFLTSHLSRTRARDGEGVTDRQFRASTISSRLSLVRGGLFSSLGKRACVLLPDSGIVCRVVDGGRPIGEKGLVHAP